MFDIIKKKYQYRQLRKMMLSRRDKRIENWEQIRTIGLVFVVGSEEQWNLLNRFISTQKQNGKHIVIIGYHPKDLAINYIFTHTETTICHEKEDFTFFGLPKEGVVDHFTGLHYDLLVDATEQPCFFGKYLTACADADLKVGYTNSETDDEGPMEMYDLTIQGNEKIDFENYMEQIVKYLTMIKK